MDSSGNESCSPLVHVRRSAKRTNFGLCFLGIGVGLLAVGVFRKAIPGGAKSGSKFLNLVNDVDGTDDEPNVEDDGPSHEDAIEEDFANTLPWLNDDGDCKDYMMTEGCGWTLEWNCPAQEGGDGKANPDGSVGYKCCCDKGYWKQAAPVVDPNERQYWSTGYHNNLTVYHQTSPAVCKLIMASNFHLGRGGLCGKAVYFALTPEATSGKAITPNSHGGCMIEAVVDVGKQGYYHGGDRGGSRRFPHNCGKLDEMNANQLHGAGYDSILMNREDGNEVIIFEPGRILSKRIMPYKCSWMCRMACQRHWPSNCRR